MGGRALTVEFNVRLVVDGIGDFGTWDDALDAAAAAWLEARAAGKDTSAQDARLEQARRDYRRAERRRRKAER